MPDILQNESVALRRRVYFTCVNNTDLSDFLQSSDMSTFTIKISKNGASGVTPSGTTITQIDATNHKGDFFWEGAASDFDTLGKMVVTITNAGGSKVMRKRNILVTVTLTDRGVFAIQQADTKMWDSTAVIAPNTLGVPRVDVRFMETSVLTNTAAADGFLSVAKIADGALSLSKFAADALLGAFGIVDRGTAQGGSSTTLQLQAGASAVNNTYTDAIAVCLSGTGALTMNQVDTYDGATKIATMKRAWTGAAPSATTVYILLAGFAAGTAPSAAANAAAVWSAICEAPHTYGDAMRGMLGVIAGPVGDFRTGILIFKNLAGTKTRFIVITDESGRISVTPVDLT